MENKYLLVNRNLCIIFKFTRRRWWKRSGRSDSDVSCASIDENVEDLRRSAQGNFTRVKVVLQPFKKYYIINSLTARAENIYLTPYILWFFNTTRIKGFGQIGFATVAIKMSQQAHSQKRCFKSNFAAIFQIYSLHIICYIIINNMYKYKQIILLDFSSI